LSRLLPSGEDGQEGPHRPHCPPPLPTPLGAHSIFPIPPHTFAQPSHTLPFTAFAPHCLQPWDYTPALFPTQPHPLHIINHCLQTLYSHHRIPRTRLLPSSRHYRSRAPPACFFFTCLSSPPLVHVNLPRLRAGFSGASFITAYLPIIILAFWILCFLPRQTHAEKTLPCTPALLALP